MIRAGYIQPPTGNNEPPTLLQTAELTMFTFSFNQFAGRWASI